MHGRHSPLFLQASLLSKNYVQGKAPWIDQSCALGSPKPRPSKPHPCNMPQAKTEVALQFLECCAAETALQHWLFCSADVICTKSCAAANEKLHCNIENSKSLRCRKVALSCLFPAGFKPPRLGTHVSDLLSADCPGSPVLGAGDAPPPELHPGASECAPGLAFAFIALRANSWICCPPASLPPVQKRDAQHMLLQHKGAHTDTKGSQTYPLTRN